MEQRRLAAIMFTDLVGYTTMMAKNEKQTLNALKKIRNTLKPLVDVYNGKWQKEIGDGTLSSFSSAVDAVHCALDFQRAIGKEDFKIRIGIHVGEVTLTENDIYGDGVNIAARIEPLAPPGGICITDRVYEDISNKPEIKTALLGHRELKNVDRPIKIYTLIGEGLPEPPNQSVKNSPGNYLKDLWVRRVPQILILYLLTSFVIIQAVDWILDKFMLSPYWLDFTWILLLSLLPSIALISYYHGKSGMDKWVRAEKIFIPVNFIVAVVILFLLFQGKDLGATTREITVEDEEGKTIKRIIPKNEFIKNIAIFGFDNITNDTSLNWLSVGIRALLHTDFDQDIFINKGFAERFYGELLSAKIKKGEIIPLPLKREIARNLKMDFFLEGTFNKDIDSYQINAKLYDTNSGRQVSENILEGENLYDIIDQLCVKIKEDLQIPSSYIQTVEDLPLSSIITPHFDAFEYYIKALEKIVFDSDWVNGIDYLLKCIEIDPEFGIANLNLANAYYYNGQQDKAAVYIEKVMNRIYMLPERTRFEAKYIYYEYNNDIDMMIKVLETWVGLYPNDLEAITFLVIEYQYLGEYSKAEDIIKEALEIDDNRGDFYVSLAEVLMKQNKREEALSYFELYVEKYPDHSQSYQLLGDYFYKEGKLDEAKQNYEKSLVLSRDNINSIMKLTLIKEKQGLYDEVEKEFINAFKYSKSANDSIVIYDAQIDYLQHRGQIQTALQIKEQMLLIVQNVYPPFAIPIFQIMRISLYLLINEADKALQILNQVNGQIMDSYKGVEYEAYLKYHIYQKEVVRSEEILELLRSGIPENGYPESYLPYWEGEIFFIKQQYDSAIDSYQEFSIDSDGFVKDETNIKIAYCLIELDRIKDAINLLNEIIEAYPYRAEAHLLMARILLDQNEDQVAKEHLDVANKVWENADSVYAYAQETRRLLEEL